MKMTKQEALQRIKELEKYVLESENTSKVTIDMIVPGASFAWVRPDGVVSVESVTLILDVGSGTWLLSGCSRNKFKLYVAQHRTTYEMLEYLADFVPVP